MSTDPRPLKGSIAGPGGPRDRNAAVVDMSHAVLLDGMDVCEVHLSRRGVPGEHAIAMVLSGRVNHTTDRAEVLFVFDVDGAAAIATELLALAERMDASDLARLIRARIDRLAQDDAMGSGK